MSGLIQTEQRDAAVILRLNRPECLNALSPQLLEALDGALSSCAATGARVVILTGTGRAFSAGADIVYMHEASRAECREYLTRAQAVLAGIESLPLPVIAAVNGTCTGGGNALANACDLRLAANSAQFGEPEAKLGLPGGFGNVPRLVRLVGPGRAAELLLTGRLIDAEHACRIGLVSEVVADDALAARACEIATEIAALGPAALAQMKGLLHNNAKPEDETSAFLACLDSGQGVEGLQAFVDKRPPDWGQSSA